MGNSLFNNGHIQLESWATINFSKTKLPDHGIWEWWIVSYSVDGSPTNLHLLRLLEKDGDTRELSFEFMDSEGAVIFSLFRAREDLLKQIKFTEIIGRFHDTKFVKEAYNPRGGVTKTNAFFHGSGKGLLVVEEKRKNGDEMPFTVTVAHYYVVSSGNVSSQNKKDIGISIVVDVWVSNDEFVVSAEGPVEHPSSALLYMFRQVSRTRTWNRMTCPHCAETQRQRGQYSESESTEGRNNLLPARLLHSPMQNARGGDFLNNEDIRRTGNGNMIAGDVHYNFFGRRQQRKIYQSETESESEDGDNLLLPARLHYPRQNGATIHANGGATRSKSNYNGSLFNPCQIVWKS